MSVIDIIIYCVLAFAVIFGFLRGFSKKRLSSFASQCGFIVAYFAGAPLVEVLAKTDLCVHIQNGYYSLLPKTEAFTTLISSDVSIRSSQMSTALEEIHIIKIFHSFFTLRATDFTSTVGDSLASSFANWTLVGATYIILFLLTFILVKIILSPLWKDGSLFGEKGKSFFGRVCGMFRMVCKVTLCIIAVMIVVSLIASLTNKFGNTYLQDWIDTELKMEDSSAFSIGKMFYKTSSYFFNWIGINTGA